MIYPALDEWIVIYEREKLDKTRIKLINILKRIFEAQFLSEFSMWRMKNGELVIISLANRLLGIWVCPVTRRLKFSRGNSMRYERYLKKRIREDETCILENEYRVFGDCLAGPIPCWEAREQEHTRRKRSLASIYLPVSFKFGRRILYAHFRRSRKIDPEQLDIFLGKGEAIDLEKHRLAKNLLIAKQAIRLLTL